MTTPKVKTLSKVDQGTFVHLVEAINAPGRGFDRNIARMQMSQFIDKHGQDACNALYREVYNREPPK